MSTPAAVIATELGGASNLIQLQLAAGLGEEDVKETLARHYESRICGLISLTSEEKSTLTTAINSGPWSAPQKKLLASSVLTSGSQLKKSAGLTRRPNQKCHMIENLIPMTMMAKLKDTTKYSEMSRLSILSAAAKSLGICNPDETTLFRMVSILAVTDPGATYSQRKVWDQMDTIQKFCKAGAPVKVEYVVTYAPTAELLPDNIKASAYSEEPSLPPPIEWIELDVILANHRKRGERSSGYSAPSESAKKVKKEHRETLPETAEPASAADATLPSIELWRMSGAAQSSPVTKGNLASDPPAVCSPATKQAPALCLKCMLPLDANGHTQ